jgi:hypothetical protein
MLAVSLKTTHRVAKIASRAKSHSPPYAAATLLKARQLMAICRGLEASLIGFLVAGTFLTTNYYPNLWTIIGFMSATLLVLEMDPDLAVLKNPAPEPALVSGFVRAASR